MRVEHYSDKFYGDTARLIRQFHNEYLKDFYGDPVQETIAKSISNFSGDNSKNAFLLFTEADELVGILAGVEIKSNLNNQRFFQEILWYVKKPWGRYGFYLISQAKNVLKSYGFSNIIMAVIENEQSSKVERIYKRMKLRKLETHYLGDL